MATSSSEFGEEITDVIATPSELEQYMTERVEEFFCQRAKDLFDCSKTGYYEDGEFVIVDRF